MIYLDNNATTAVPHEVLDAMEPYYTRFYGNAHSAHALGRAAHDGLEAARRSLARLIAAQPEEIRFTSCGTESNAIVIRGIAYTAQRRGVVASTVEHPSILSLLRSMHSRGEISLTLVGVDRTGRVDLAALRSAVNDSTALVCLMLAQNELGTLQPVPEAAAIAHACGALLLVDAVQAAGKIAIDVAALGADFLSLSGHKLHAPKGVGALYVRRGLALDPLWLGGGQEFGLRSGTEPVAAIVGLGKAAELALAALDTSEVAALRDRFERRIAQNIEIRVNGALDNRLQNTSSISFPGIYAADLVRALDEAGICASGGAACDSGKREPTAVMTAIGAPLDDALGAVRFSLSRYTTLEEIDSAADAVCAIASRLRPLAVAER